MAFDSLHAACAAASTRTVEDVAALVAQGHDVNATDKEGRTPLHLAARNDKLEIAAFLLSKGAAVDAKMPRGFTPLHYAARHARLALVQCLVDHGADVNAAMEHGLSVVHIAAEKGRLDVVEYLHSKGVDLKAVMWRGVSVAQLAAREGHLALVKYFIENGTDVNSATKEGVSILHDAANREHHELVAFLLDHGADHTATDRQGRTALHRALWGFHKKCSPVYTVVLALVSRGATWDRSCERELATTLRRFKSDLSKDDVAASSNAQRIRALRWQAGFKVCVLHWTEQRLQNAALTDVPIEVLQRGEDSAKTYLAGIQQSSAEQLILRRKVCVVGPSKWGKTSLVKSLTSLKSTLVDVDDRTIGIDLFAHSFEEMDEGTSTKKRHELTFWDFAGQDEYQVAHAMFFSKRTLYLLCVDLEKYEAALAEADALLNVREAEHFMTRFLRANVFRWVRSIISRQADAEFVVVGTKMDKMKSEKQADLLWRDLYARLSEWTRTFVDEIDQELTASANSDTVEDNSQIESLKTSLTHLFSKEWIKVSSTDAKSIKRALKQLETKISSSERSFAMPVTYTQVLEAVRARSEKAARMSDSDRVANTIVPVRALYRDLSNELGDLSFEDCRAILETLHDLGDLLWYQHEASGILKDTIILDPTLVLDFVREVITHEHSSRYDNVPESFIAEGRLTHSFLHQLHMWKNLDDELTFAFKQLLQYFQLAYPADNTEMDWDSDLIIPTYWKVNNTADLRARLTHQSSLIKRHGVSSASLFCWEYELSSEVSDTVFEQFAVQSYSSMLKRTVQPKCIEAFVHGDCAALITLSPSVSSRDAIRIEVAVADATVGWNYLRYYVMAMETVLDTYPGLVISRYVVDSDDSTTRHRLSSAIQMLEDALWMGKDESSVREEIPWLSQDVNWFIEKAWRQPGALQQLRTQELVREAVNKVDVLKKLVVADEARRRYPALWTLQYDSKHHKAVLKMLSDLSGECFHEPIKIDVPSAFFAKHGSVLQTGMAILSNVVPEIVSLGILQKVIDTVAPVVDSHVERAVALHNLIDNLDLSANGVAQPITSKEKLSPRGVLALLRDLLKLHDTSFDELTVSDLANLQCAATADGHYVWASRQEIMALGDELTPCDPEDLKPLKRSLSSTSTASTASMTSLWSTDESHLRLRLSFPSITGLSAWDWRRTYCKWQLVHSSSSRPLAVGSTPPHADSSVAPSWPAIEFSVATVESVKMLRECRLLVRVKRPSRCLGLVKLIAEGALTLGDSEALQIAEQLAETLVVEIPLDAQRPPGRFVTVHVVPC